MDFDPAALFHTSPFHRWLGCRVVQMDRREAVIELPFREEFVGDPDRVVYHGGVITALVDAAATFALIAHVERDCVTLDCRVDFLRPAGKGRLIARAWTTRPGRRFGLVDVEVEDEWGRRVALGRATLAVINPRPLSSDPSSDPSSDRDVPEGGCTPG